MPCPSPWGSGLAALSVLVQAVGFAFFGALSVGLWVLGRLDRLRAPSTALSTLL